MILHHSLQQLLFLILPLLLSFFLHLYDSIFLFPIVSVPIIHIWSVFADVLKLLAVQYQKCRSGGIITARAFNHTGPGQLPSFVLPSFAKQIAEMEAGLIPPVLKVGDINVKRDFTDVRDVVVAYCELLDKGTVGEVYNVCSGRAVLLTDLVGELQKDCSVTVKIEVDHERVRPSDVPQVVGDPSKIQSVTGWTSRIPLETTLKDLLVYWRTAIKPDMAEDDDELTKSLP